MTEDTHEWRWSREGVQHRIASMAPADALLTVEQYNVRRFRDVASQLDPEICFHGLANEEIEEVRRRVAKLRRSATAWGRRYWVKRRLEAEQDVTTPGDDSEIIAEMSAWHPGFSTESLVEVYNTGIMLAR